MGYTVKKAENDEYILKIVQDDDVCDSPRDWDNLGHMVCWHGRYDLGDKNLYGTPRDFLEDLVDGDIYDKIEKMAEEKYSKYTIERDGNEWDIRDENGDYFDGGYITEESAERFLEQQKDSYIEEIEDDELMELIQSKNLILPLYLYDHSGITISTSTFNDRWDSGQIGWTYVSHDEIIKEYGSLDIEKAKKLLFAEAEIYDQYLRGNVYGFELIEKDEDGGTWNIIDSCWGFYGLDYIEGEIASHIGEEYLDLIKNLG